jgi:hypothetical protein
MFAADIADFTNPKRDDDIQRYIHKSLYEMLENAFDRSGLPWSECMHEDRGDGVLIGLPPNLPVTDLIDPLPERLRGLVRRHNRVSCPAAHIQLRIAVHVGPICHDGKGFIGGEMNLLFRLLETRQLKQMLVASGAEVALITSGYMYENVVCRQPSLIDPAVFQRVKVHVKQTRTRAWVYVPAVVPPSGGRP